MPNFYLKRLHYEEDGAGVRYEQSYFYTENKKNKNYKEKRFFMYPRPAAVL